MSIQSIQAIYFSPTKTTKKNLHAIMEGTGLKILDDIDLTLKNDRDAWEGNVEGDIIVVGSPIYGRAIPLVYLQKLKELKGDNKLGVGAICYGHVKFGDSLEQMVGLMQDCGLKVVAAGYFLGEHSFTSKKLVLAPQRPDQADLRKASEFGENVKEKLSQGQMESSKLSKIDLKGRKPKEKPINRPIKIYPSAPSKECTNCGACAENCPVDCIDPQNYNVDLEVCIQCMACVKLCPEQAREVVFNIPKQKIKHFQEFDTPIQKPKFWV